MSWAAWSGVRSRVEGRVRVEARGVGGGSGLTRVAVTVENLTDCDPAGVRRDAVLDRSFVAVHTMLAVEGGAFVSLLDPPGTAREAAAGCRNEGSFPVLVGWPTTWSCRRRSSSTTTLRWLPRAPATSTTRPRSTRSWRCGS